MRLTTIVSITVIITFLVGCNVPDTYRNRKSLIFPERYVETQSVEIKKHFNLLKNIIYQETKDYGFKEIIQNNQKLSSNQGNVLNVSFESVKNEKSYGLFRGLEGSDSKITIDLFLGRFNSLSKKYYFVLNIVDWTDPNETQLMLKIQGEIRKKLINEFGYENIRFEKQGVFILNN